MGVCWKKQVMNDEILWRLGQVGRGVGDGEEYIDRMSGRED